MSHEKAIELPEGGFKLKKFDDKGSFVAFSEETYATEEEALASKKPAPKKKEVLEDALLVKKKRTTKKKD